jgi:hypothetical protein
MWINVSHGLDFSPTLLNRAFGMTWSVGGWLVVDAFSG